MNIGLNDLDPKVAEKISARANALYGMHNLKAEDITARNVLYKRWKGKGGQLAGRTLLGTALGTGIGVSLGALIGNPGAMGGLGFFGGYLATLGTVIGSLVQRRKIVQTQVTAEELRAVMSNASLTTTEETYIEVVCSLLEAGENINNETGKDILQALGTVLERYRHIESQLERLQKIVGTESVQALEADFARLKERTAAAEDAQARNDLNHSLTMCEKRLQDVQALVPSIERLEAQKEVLHQTLLTIQASVVRLQAAPRAVSLPDTSQIHQAVENVTIQTRAVEDAVNEVLVLQSK